MMETVRHVDCVVYDRDNGALISNIITIPDDKVSLYQSAINWKYGNDYYFGTYYPPTNRLETSEIVECVELYSNYVKELEDKKKIADKKRKMAIYERLKKELEIEDV